MSQELDGDFLSFDEDGFPSEAGPSTGSEDPSGVRRRLFNKELRCMLYGYGDDLNSYTEVVDFLEDLVLEFISELTHKALEIGRVGKVQVEDIIFLVRKQPKMYARVKQLLIMNEELKKARKAFDEIKYVQGGS
ncbi:TAF13 [Lepeophtheirus salmonis]|uniref:Transcription initiation factor TFIID subunit 13 n=1 Tax=Lepeophtheirus salmonis TaxID=72036 RepID=C1BSM8_LEPSM|nr:transcription initiation factor TFIID subunit 13-like [Lepeophtheirus salmonis]ACO12031.1 Transcription initiation factor TFIID subunit 13 [Lepeophtheirus salmonis]ADD37903.1 Transcription initiation factor TFIID subunit 13 [Lepeophtheirus salmonis]CAB4055132.1 TAF13 [Lepeophtheirus salmonis]CAF2769423.1 TAF13 [Lepeophtheirus salmonis]